MAHAAVETSSSFLSELPTINFSSITGWVIEWIGLKFIGHIKTTITIFCLILTQPQHDWYEYFVSKGRGKIEAFSVVLLVRLPEEDSNGLPGSSQ